MAASVRECVIVRANLRVIYWSAFGSVARGGGFYHGGGFYRMIRGGDARERDRSFGSYIISLLINYVGALFAF